MNTRLEELEKREEQLVFALLDVLFQSCGVLGDLDSQGTAAYQDAMDLLKWMGYLKTKDGRIYKLTDKAKKLWKKWT